MERNEGGGGTMYIRMFFSPILLTPSIMVTFNSFFVKPIFVLHFVFFHLSNSEYSVGMNGRVGGGGGILS